MNTGDRIGRFEVRGKIGSGGMGEVYLAKDPSLNRNVAIKILGKEVVADSDKLTRFVREAQAASALNHPNIVTVYEIGEWKGDRFIALEHVEGRTLSATLSETQPDLRSALELSLQIASALDAAHSAGIVHRDIKPENVMVRNDGIVKVLDFGIAKLTETPSERPESEAETALKVDTVPGMILGTASYMSPEQAKGREIDSRSDIFSLGVVLYEMVAGRLPFSGDSVLEMIGSILKDEPAPLPGDLPRDLKRIISKSLRKDPDERYQTMKGLIADLKQFLRETDGGGSLPSRADAEEDRVTKFIDPGTHEEGRQPTIATGSIRKVPRVVTAVGSLIVVAAGAYALYYFFYRSPAKEPFSRTEITEVRSGAFTDYPVISPDGKLLAYVRFTSGNRSVGELTVRQIESGEEVVIHKPDMYTRIECFSHDGQFIYFTENPGRTTNTLYRISALGGTKRKVSTGRSIVAVSASPNGESIVFRQIVEGKGPTIFTARPDGQDKTEVLTLSDLGAEDLFVGGWTPDSKKFLIAIFPEAPDEVSSPKGIRTQLAVYDPRDDGGKRADKVEIFHDRPWEDISQSMAFLADGTDLVVLAMERGSRFQLYRISYPEGEAVRITNDNSDYLSLTVSGDGKTILTSTVTELASLWSLDPASGETSQIRPEDPGLYGYSISGTQDGRLFFVKYTNRGSTILSVNEDGSDEKEHFTVPGRLRNARVTPDGRSIVATVWVADSIAERLVRFDLDGSGRKEITKVTNGGDFAPTFTGDGRVIFERVTYASARERRLFTVKLDGTDERELTGLSEAIAYFNPSISPDGRLLAYQAETEGKEPGTRRYSLRVVEIKTTAAGSSIAGATVFESDSSLPRIRWWPDGSAVIFEDESEPTNDLYKLALSGGDRSRVSEFKLAADSGDFRWNKAKDRLLVLRVTRLSEIVTIRDLSE